jgi:predicted dehydrogenase
MDEVLSDPDVDAVIVATPHPLHVGPGIKALAAGKHLFMQKPLCGDMAEADAFVEAAKKSDKVVYVLPHAAAELVASRHLIREGAIGKPSGAYARTSHGGPEVYYAQVRDAFREPEGDLWFFDAKEASVGALFDMGVYAVAGLINVLGTVRRVTGITRTMDKPTPLEDTATLILEFASGVIATAETSWCDPVTTWEFRFHGTRGSLTAPAYGDGLTRREPGSYVKEGVPAIPHPVDLGPFDRGSPTRYFVNLVRNRRQPDLSHALAARHVTEVLLAGLESARTGRPVAVTSSAE